MARPKVETRYSPSHVTPQIDGDTIRCECGAKMEPWNFVAVPSQRRSILWRCSANPDHVSSMIPLPKEER